MIWLVEKQNGIQIRLEKTVSEDKIWIMRGLVQITSQRLPTLPGERNIAEKLPVFSHLPFNKAIWMDWFNYSDSHKGPCPDYVSSEAEHSTWGKPPPRLLAWPTSGLGSNQCSYVCLGHKTFKLAIGLFENLIHISLFGRKLYTGAVTLVDICGPCQDRPCLQLI